jgi:hypothetical protein
MRKVVALSLVGTCLVMISVRILVVSDKTDSVVEVPAKGIPIPTQVYEHMQDEAGFGERKRNYFDHIHGNHPNWREINQQNFQSIYEMRAQQRQNKVVEIFAGGELEAEWIQRGSNNLAGNVQVADFDPATEKIYAISDGGVVWRGSLNDEDWEPLNDDIRFGVRVIKVLTLPSGGLRIVAARGHGIFYSDNEGVNWTQATGFTSDWDYGYAIDLVQLNDAQKTLVYVYNAYSFGLSDWQNRLAYSTNNGASWTVSTNFNTNDGNFISMSAPHNSARAYILNGNSESYYFQGTTLTSVNNSLTLSGSDACYLAANMTSTDTTLYALLDNTELYKSTNGGLSYTFVASTPVSSWEAGIAVSIENPDVIYMGEMELWRSLNGGTSFNKVNDWWEYYDDVPGKIHADIMSISSFMTSGGDEFTLIPNHGGISVSYDQLATTENIGMLNLNVGQFYDVITSPINSDYVFGGSQDQGFQRSIQGNLLTTSYFEQVISGDYGQMQFSNNGQGIWTQYPGADFAYYEDAMNDASSLFWYNIDGDNMPNYDWIVPTEAPINPSDDYIFVGGGEESGGSGSYLIKLINDGGTPTTFQYNYDFYAASGGGTISAIGVTPLDANKLYVSTDNGKFFYSEDSGASWNMTSSFTGPEGDWIFSSDIYASRATAGLVFVCGAGYSTDAVHMSTDGGVTFQGIWDAPLPETAVHELCMDPFEKYLFAATDAGPYVYVMDQNQWYSLLGLSAPVQNYMSVEYVEMEHLVRFSTYGRGIWDFKLMVGAGNEELLANENNSFFYPNPSVNASLTVLTEKPARLYIYSMQGHEVFSSMLSEEVNQFNLPFLAPGSYALITVDLHGNLKKDIWIKK